MAGSAHDAPASPGQREALDALTVEAVESLDSVRQEWSGLARASANVFSTWEWAALWWRHFGHSGRLAVSSVSAPGGETVAILPLS